MFKLTSNRKLQIQTGWCTCRKNTKISMKWHTSPVTTIIGNVGVRILLYRALSHSLAHFLPIALWMTFCRGDWGFRVIKRCMHLTSGRVDTQKEILCFFPPALVVFEFHQSR